MKEEVEEEVEEEEEEDQSQGWMRPGKVRAGEAEPDMRGKVLPEERGGVEAGYEEASSGKGYSNFFESVAKGVPTS